MEIRGQQIRGLLWISVCSFQIPLQLHFILFLHGAKYSLKTNSNKITRTSGLLMKLLNTRLYFSWLCWQIFFNWRDHNFIILQPYIMPAIAYDGLFAIRWQIQRIFLLERSISHKYEQPHNSFKAHFDRTNIQYIE